MSAIKLLFIVGMGIILYSCNNTNMFDIPKNGKLEAGQRAKRSSGQELAIDKTASHAVILPEEFDSLASLISTFWYYAMSGPEIRVGVSSDLALQFQLNVRHYYNQNPIKFKEEFLNLKLEDLQLMMVLSKPIWANSAFTADASDGGARSKRHARSSDIVQDGYRWEKILKRAVETNDRSLLKGDKTSHSTHKRDLREGIWDWTKSSLLLGWLSSKVHDIEQLDISKIKDAAIHKGIEFASNIYESIKHTPETIDIVRTIFLMGHSKFAEKVANANLLDGGLLAVIGSALVSGLMEKEDLGDIVVLDCTSSRYKEYFDSTTGKRSCYDTRPRRSAYDIVDEVSTIDQLNNFLPDFSLLLGVFQAGIELNGEMGGLPAKLSGLGNAYKIQINVHPGRTEILRNGEKKVVMRVKIFLRTELSISGTKSFRKNKAAHFGSTGKFLIARNHGIDIPLIRNEKNTAWVTYNEGISYLEEILIRGEGGVSINVDNFVSQGERLIEDTFSSEGSQVSRFLAGFQGSPSIGIENGWHFHWDFQNRNKAIAALGVNLGATVVSHITGTVIGMFGAKQGPVASLMIGEGVSAVVEGITLATESIPGSHLHPDKINGWVGLTFGLEAYFSGKRSTLKDPGGTFTRYLSPTVRDPSVGNGISLRNFFSIGNSGRGRWSDMGATEDTFRTYATKRLKANGIKSSTFTLGASASLIFVLAKDWIIFLNDKNKKTKNFDVD